jgi:hypothetical protein
MFSMPPNDKGKALNVDGLWALVFGDGTNNAATTSLYFTAGPNMESEGIFGKFYVSTKKSKSSDGSDMPGPDPGMMLSLPKTQSGITGWWTCVKEASDGRVSNSAAACYPVAILAARAA